MTTPAHPAWRVNVTEVLLDERLGSGADRAAIRFPSGEWTLGEVARRAGAAAGVLRERGIQQGQVVILALPDSPGWVVAFLALTRLGAVAALAPSATPRERLLEAIARAAPLAAVTDDPSLAPGVPCIPPADLEDASADDPGPASTRGTDVAYLLLTSGSTGPSKWAVHRQRDIPFCLATYGRHILKLRPGDVTYSSGSLAASYGLGNSLYFPIGAGACAWIDGERPSPQQAAAACVAGDVNVILGVPTFWARVARHVAEGRVPSAPFAQVRLAVSAGEPLPEAVFDAVRDRLGLELVDGLGSSEATNLYLSNRPGHAVRGSVGRVVPGFEVTVAAPPDGDATGGELLVRGGSVMAGYLGDDAASERALAGGWLHTGDLVERRGDGTFRFLGRVGDRFKSGGLWVDPHRVARVLAEHPGVAEAAVLGIPDELGVTRVVAVVAAAGDADAVSAAVVMFARSRLGAHEQPRAVAVVPELPTTASGKVRRDEIVKIATAALGREVVVAA